MSAAPLPGTQVRGNGGSLADPQLPLSFAARTGKRPRGSANGAPKAKRSKSARQARRAMAERDLVQAEFERARADADAAAADAANVRVEARAEIDKLSFEKSNLQGELDKLKFENSNLRRDLDGMAHHASQLEQKLGDAARRASQLERELGDVTRRAFQLERERDDEVGHATKLRQKLDDETERLRSYVRGLIAVELELTPANKAAHDAVALLALTETASDGNLRLLGAVPANVVKMSGKLAKIANILAGAKEACERNRGKDDAIHNYESMATKMAAEIHTLSRDIHRLAEPIRDVVDTTAQAAAEKLWPGAARARAAVDAWVVAFPRRGVQATAPPSS